MAASDNLAAMEPWAYRPTTTFADSWISEAFARDTKALTMALQKSLADNRSSESPDSEFLPFFDTFQAETTATPTVSGVSGSDPESVAAPKLRQRNAVPVSGGKVTKRKSRASKRTQTTFITADPANFRQMVQQVTGVRFNGQQFSSLPTVVRPEPQRPGGNRLPGGGCLPTLDTSALLFDHHQQQQQQQQQQQYQQQVVGPASATGGGGQMGPMRYGATVEVAEGGGGVSGGGLGFDSYSSFPTLESWKVM